MGGDIAAGMGTFFLTLEVHSHMLLDRLRSRKSREQRENDASASAASCMCCMKCVACSKENLVINIMRHSRFLKVDVT